MPARPAEGSSRSLSAESSRTVCSAGERVVPYRWSIFVRERSFNDDATKRGVGVHGAPAVDFVCGVAVCDRGREGDGRGWKDVNCYGCCNKQQAQGA